MDRSTPFLFLANAPKDYKSIIQRGARERPIRSSARRSRGVFIFLRGPTSFRMFYQERLLVLGRSFVESFCEDTCLLLWDLTFLRCPRVVMYGTIALNLPSRISFFIFTQDVFSLSLFSSVLLTIEIPWGIL